ncbi:hypothetical protein ABIA85_009590 [Bradyrhizobium sp. LA6.10]
MTEISDGDKAEAVAFVARLQRIYLGKPDAMWLSGEMDEDLAE